MIRPNSPELARLAWEFEHARAEALAAKRRAKARRAYLRALVRRMLTGVACVALASLATLAIDSSAVRYVTRGLAMIASAAK